MSRTLNSFLSLPAIILIAGVFIALAFLTDLATQPYLLWVLTLSIVTLLFYGYDKLQAKRGGWRVPERVLHVLGLVGGFLGGWLGMVVFRHKKNKQIFKLWLAAATILHVGGYLCVGALSDKHEEKWNVYWG